VKKISSIAKALLVGDNPFHSISHLSQGRTRLREKTVVVPKRAADLILNAVGCGANGFMFSVSETTLSILKELRTRGEIERLGLYAIVPYASEYVKLSTQVGGVPGLARKVAKRIVASGNLGAMLTGLIGYLKTDPWPLMKTYLSYEIGRIRSSGGKRARLESILLHEVITDVALALKLDWLFKAYIKYASNLGITPGFNTCNFGYLIDRFREWDIDLSQLAMASPFNKIGFQMTPSKKECEKALESILESNVIAISILAAGYLKPLEAAEYLATLPNISGVAVGISKPEHAQTFKLLKEKLSW